MTNKDKFNIIIRTILCMLFFIIGIYGYILYLSGYGENGKIRQNLTKIVDTFNNLNNVKNNIAKINAKYKSKSIVVSYETDKADIEYIFKYEKNNTFDTLLIEYSTSDASRAEDVVKGIIDSISIIAGNQEGKLFEKYKYRDFYKTTVEQGAYISNYNGKVITRIRINTNMLKNLDDTFIGQESIVTYISQDDLRNIKEELSNNKKYTKEKNYIVLHIIETDTNYIFYISDKLNNNNNIFESIMSGIYHLNQNVYNELLTSNKLFTSNYESSSYKVEVNPQIIETDIQMPSELVVKVTIPK